MPPYPSYLVFGYVYDSNGVIVSSASLKIKTSVSTIYKTTNSDGIFMYDLSDAGYETGETVDVVVTEPLNNELKAHTFVVTGMFLEENITLAIRTAVENSVGYASMNVLHSVGKTPITADNPLPVTQDSSQIFEERRAYNSDGQVEYIGEAKAGTQESVQGWRIQKRTYVSNRLTKIAWSNYDAKFNKIWNSRISYNYR